MSAHTQGPWVVMPHFSEYVIPASDLGKGIGASVDPEEDATRYATPIASGAAFARRRAAGEHAANLQLIAAAPELLEACQSIVDSLEGGQTEPHEAIAAVRSAIAKATGGAA